MTQEEKELLLKDLCARLPYGVKINHIIYNWEGTLINFNSKLEYLAMEKDNGLCYDVPIEEARPYLRPMSSITRDESFELGDIMLDLGSSNVMANVIDFYNERHLDYRGLIPMGLAFEATEDMYKTK
jgi:hypothetical protein